MSEQGTQTELGSNPFNPDACLYKKEKGLCCLDTSRCRIEAIRADVEDQLAQLERHVHTASVGTVRREDVVWLLDLVEAQRG